MTKDLDPIADRLSALYAEYKQQLPGRLSQIETQLEAVLIDADNEAKLGDLLFSLHKLAGSGATFGFDEITRISRQWERFIQSKLKAKEPLSPEDRSMISSLLNELRQAVSAAGK